MEVTMRRRLVLLLIVMACMAGCANLNDEGREEKATVETTLTNELRRLPPVRPPAWTPLKAEWTFALGTPREGLDAPLSLLPEKRERVSIPHRLLEPDTPFWYVADVDIPGDAVFAVFADDGAHLFVDGARIPMERGAFNVPGPARRARIVVRAINKAMEGGLSGVRVTARADYERSLDESDIRARLDALVGKASLMPALAPEQVEAVRGALRAADQESVDAAEKALSAFPVVVVGPYLQSASTHGVSVVWETDVPCAASVAWGDGSAQSAHVEATSDGTLHVARLEPLRPGAEYGYTIASGPSVSERFTFRALPEGDAVDFTAWADAQNTWDVFAANVATMGKLPLSFTVSVGDAVERGSLKEPWMGLFKALQPMAPRVPTMLVGGNHEYDECFEDMRCPFFERYGRTLPAPQYYAWTAGNARFVALDPNPYFPTDIPEGSAQRAWLMRELESDAWKQAGWRFIFIHQPPYSQGWTDYHGDPPIRALLESVAEKYGVDFVVSGHTHDYERLTRSYGKQKVHYVIVGGAGSGLERGPLSAEPVMDTVIRKHHVAHFHVEGNRVVLRVIGVNGEVLDSLVAVK
jgi:hypothetical protein